MDVQLFIPCFIDQFYPNTAFNTIQLLEKAGCNVHYNPNQTCCGQPSFNSGYWDDTTPIAKKWLKDFDADITIVSPSASCSGFVKNHYHKLFRADEKQWLDNTQRARKKIYELSDFLVNMLNFTDFKAQFPHRITYHDACSALREYGIREEPRQLLSKVQGLELVEMPENTTCCGFGGTFSVKHTAISSAMVEKKVENAQLTGVEYIVSTEASCLMNIGGYIEKHNLPIKILHLADVLVGE